MFRTVVTASCRRCVAATRPNGAAASTAATTAATARSLRGQSLSPPLSVATYGTLATLAGGGRGGACAAVSPPSPSLGVVPLRRTYSQTARTELPPPGGGGGNDDFPSNLTFDRKSSFGPKRGGSLLVAPPGAVEENDEEHGDGKAVDRPIEEEVVDTGGYDDDDDDDEGLADAWAASAPPPSLRPVVPLPDRLRTDIFHGPDGTVVGSLWLDPTVFGADPVRIDLIKQAVDYIRAKIRGRRKAKSKTIGERSGSGRKVRQQKGTGKARAGHSRPAHWRGGAKAHGPKNTVDYGNVKMNKRQRVLAIRSTLSQKLKEGNLILVDHWRLPSHKTRDLARVLQEAYGIGKSDNGTTALILDHYHEPGEGEEKEAAAAASYHGVPVNLWVASSNLHKVKVANQRFANVYDILKKEKLVLTLSALEQIESRWKES